MKNCERAKRVLVVDDEPDFTSLLEIFLSSEGYEVVTSLNGEEALKKINEWTPDAITLDIQMPKKSGIVFYRQIKSTAKYQHIPVIIITGLTRNDKDMNTIIHSLLEPENVPVPDFYLEKPVDKETLLATVKQLFHSEP
ncbi:MAG: response regulator [Candidatus Omnitrophota bacterium]